MLVESEVDINLLYLERLILSLNSFTFDDDVKKSINELQTLVCDKLYSFMPGGDFKIVKSSVTLKFLLENEKSIDMIL